MSRYNNTQENGWVTMTELTSEGCREVSDTESSSASSALPESPVDSLSATSSEDAENHHLHKASPATSGTGSFALPHRPTRNNPDGIVVNIHLLSQKMSEKLSAAEGPNEGRNYAVAANPRTSAFLQQIPRSALPRTFPEILTPAYLAQLAPNVMKTLPVAKVKEWIETCNRYGHQDYVQPNSSASDDEEPFTIQIEDLQQNANTAGNRQEPEDPESDTALSEDSDTSNH